MRLIPQPQVITEREGVTRLRSITEKVIDKSVIGSEAYELSVQKDYVKASASSPAGLFYAEITFGNLLKIYKDEIPCVIIKDSPRFSYRGFMVDCARHMFPVEELKRIINTASELKFNKFHWHLTDDQGFRIQLDCYPELYRKGSIRNGDNFGTFCRSDEKYGGYYTKSEIQDIINFCSERFIEVIPEFDMPGHVSSLLHVFPELSCTGKNVEIKQTNGIFRDVLCAGNKKTEEVIKNIISEIADMFPSEYIHVGGDEAPRFYWKSCPLCQKAIKENGLADEDELQSFFINKISEFAATKNKTLTVWNDCLKGKNLNKNITVEHWMKNPSLTASEANSGRKVILAPFRPYYCDYPYGMHPLREVYDFEPYDFTDFDFNGRDNILGIETPVWTEFINTSDRIEYMCFPRFHAVAETAWSNAYRKDYKEFEKALIPYMNSLRRNKIYTAPESDWNPSPLGRCSESLSFFINMNRRKK